MGHSIDTITAPRHMLAVYGANLHTEGNKNTIHAGSVKNDKTNNSSVNQPRAYLMDLGNHFQATGSQGYNVIPAVILTHLDRFNN